MRVFGEMCKYERNDNGKMQCYLIKECALKRYESGSKSDKLMEENPCRIYTKEWINFKVGNIYHLQENDDYLPGYILINSFSFSCEIV